jgi:hypothetical protein
LDAVLNVTKFEELAFDSAEITLVEVLESYTRICKKMDERRLGDGEQTKANLN